VFVPQDAFKPADLAFFSGFVAGDGCFIIRANNSGASWCCTLDVRLRADNTPLLSEFRTWSGAGELFAAPARGNSAPQTSWNVARRLDCLKVTRILDQRPPLGKAALQFELWRRAVDIWVAEGGASPALPALAAEIRELHRSACPVPCAVDISETDLAAFLAGFASAEAHFGATDAGSPRFAINLRADDGPLLRLFRETFGIGHLRAVQPAGGSRPAVSWRIGRLCDLRRLVALFDLYPPRGRAGYVYSAWRELVMLEVRTSVVRRALAVEIRRRRRHVPGLGRIARMSRAEVGRYRCAGALLRWALSGECSGSATGYMRWRRSSDPEAPTRNTIARLYGSWRTALEALGLETDACRSKEQVAAIRAANAPSVARRRAESRNAILTAVRRCIAEIGHVPGASEFLRWRATRAPDCPSQMTIYRRFPGGFADVIAAALADDATEAAL
jgi:LAGLIDADG DNA endonuclease family protein